MSLQAIVSEVLRALGEIIARCQNTRSFVQSHVLIERNSVLFMVYI